MGPDLSIGSLPTQHHLYAASALAAIGPTAETNHNQTAPSFCVGGCHPTPFKLECFSCFETIFPCAGMPG